MHTKGHAVHGFQMPMMQASVATHPPVAERDRPLTGQRETGSAAVHAAGPPHAGRLEELIAALDACRSLLEELPAVAYLAQLGERDTWPIHYVGREIEEALGYPRQAWMEDPGFWSRHLHPEDRLDAEAWWREVRSGAIPIGRPSSIEYRMVAADGREVWFRDRAVLRPDGLIHGLMLDVTEEREALERARRAEEERRLLLARMVGAEERERQRIALDLHDGPVQWLAAAALHLRRLEELVPDPGARATADRVAQLVERTVRGLRGLMFDLHPVLEREGLVPALREHLYGLSATADQPLDWRLEDDLDGEPPPDVARLAFRIVQEALANVRKHAQASSVTVQVSSIRGGVHLRVQDDGVGFDVDAARRRPGHLGLASMRERAELAGGEFTVDSRPGGGTTVEAWLPVAPTAERWSGDALRA